MPNHLTFADYDLTPEPEQIAEIYASGFPGTRVEEDGRHYRTLAQTAPSFYGTFPLARGRGKGRLSMPIRAVQTLEGQDFCADRGESQRQGDCVGKMVRNAGMIDYATDALFGETAYRGLFCCENIYGMRGHGGEGADCARLAAYVSQSGSGGFLPRGVYTATDGTSYDLSKYRPDLSGPWGRRGTPEWLNQRASENKALNVYRVRSLDEARDALAFGFGLGRCGSDGYESTRDANGVSDARGTWYHAIAVGAVDDSQFAHDNYGGPLWLHFHNWGKWNSGPKRHDQPDGSWWVRSKYLERWITSGACWAFASVRGYDRQLIYDRAEKIAQL